MQPDRFDREWKNVNRRVTGLGVVVVLLGAAFWGVVIWAIVQLVQWVTSQ